MIIGQNKKLFSFAGLLLLTILSKAQPATVSEGVLKKTIDLTTQLPANIQDAHRQYQQQKQACDSLELLLTQAYPMLVDRMNKRSARLNAMINHNAENAVFSLAPPNQKMTTFFMNQWEKMDALERVFNKAAPSFFGDKELYKKRGYLVVWDSVYRQRRPALAAYRDAVINLVKADIAFLNRNAAMFASKNEAERMQWVEAELGVLQKLVLLKEKYKKLVMTDGAEKVAFCVERPEACAKEK